MSLREQISDDLKSAMRGGDAARRDTIRLVLAALKQREVDERKVLDAAAVQRYGRAAQEPRLDPSQPDVDRLALQVQALLRDPAPARAQRLVRAGER